MQAISYKFILIPLLQSLLYFNPNPVVAHNFIPWQMTHAEL